MKADHLSYRRATNVTLLGLVVQAVMAGLLFLYAFLTRDHAAMTASIYVAIGMAVWVALAIVFDQHRRERIEAFEAESFRESDASGSSVFEEGGDELRVAARRLQTMHKVFLPAVSLLVGAALIGAGVLRFLAGRGLVDPDNFRGGDQTAFVLGVSLAVTVMGFILARYVSGMAKQRVWQHLSAGASQAVGASIFGLLLAVGAFVALVGPDVMQRYLQIALPILMVVLGAEVFLNFVLDLYRPRRATELPRPAVDSRVLSLIAAPDRIAESIGEAINYQFGTDVTSNWFYRLLSRWGLAMVVAGVVVIWLLSSFVVIEPHQRAMHLRFGKILNPDVGPGLHVKAPWPVDRMVVPVFYERNEKGEVVREERTATGVRVLHLASAPARADGPILWTNEHVQEEQFLVVRAGESRSREDFALLAIEIPVHYRVVDVELFERLGRSGQRDAMLTAVGQRAVSRFLAGRTMDAILGVARDELADALRRQIVASFEELNGGQGAGIEVVYVGAHGAHPPKDVARDFENVVVASQKVESMREAAMRDEIETLTSVVGSVEMAREIFEEIRRLAQMGDATQEEIALQKAAVDRLLAEAGGQAYAMMAEAGAERWERHMGALSAARRYEGQIHAYRAGPEVFKAIRYLETLSEILKDNRLFIISDGLPVRVRMDLEDKQTATQEVFQSYSDE